ncbi:HD domain-containing protein [Streptomyces diacarni]|uniref:HD domain-containing protein n=1 Tax=Streptomyces diacarni TaxID=2800381 RepID=UPI0011C078C0|nr:HD domain-containing protein [Streptomyces diacarni]
MTRPSVPPAAGVRAAADRRLAAGIVAWVYAAAAALAVAALCVTLWRGAARPGTAVAFGLVVAVGELARVRLPQAEACGGAGRSTGLVCGAGALGYALLGAVEEAPLWQWAAQAVTVALVGSLVGSVPHVALGQAPSPWAAGRLTLGVAFAATCGQSLSPGGVFAPAVGRGVLFTLSLLLLALLAGCVDAFLAAATAATAAPPPTATPATGPTTAPGTASPTGPLAVAPATLPPAAADPATATRTAVPPAQGGAVAEGATRPYGPLLRAQLRARLVTVPAVAATAVLLALAFASAGLWALPVCCTPLLLTQVVLRRRAPVRATRRRTLASLAKTPEVAGCTPRGRARRVADLSRAVGRELGLSGGELTAVEYAALVHDVGQLSLTGPAHRGATAGQALGSRRGVALSGGAVVRQTGVGGRVATAVEAQADPYREQSLTARVVRTVNAYEDLLTAYGGHGHVAAPDGGGAAEGPAAAAGPRERALRALRGATARDHEPRVVEALSRVVSRCPVV